jgi:hypothetical protein
MDNEAVAASSEEFIYASIVPQTQPIIVFIQCNLKNKA